MYSSGQATFRNASITRWPAKGGTAFPTICIISRWLTGRRVPAGNPLARLSTYLNIAPGRGFYLLRQLIKEDRAMPRGDKDKYTEKQKRKAEHIEESYETKGVSEDEAERRAWATVNKQSGGGERKGGSGQKTSSADKAKARRSSARHAAQTRQEGVRSGQSFEDMTKTELMYRAREQGIAGRSTMRKDELINALRQSG